MFVAGMLAVIACGPSAEEKAAAEKQTQDSIAAAEQSRKDAEAAANEALVRAGLTPQERAEWDYKTQVGVAEQLAKIQFPEMMIIGGDNKGGQLDPFNAIGLKSFIEIQKGLTK